VGVLPFSLCRNLVETRQWPVRMVEYHGGETERMALTATARRSWQMAKRLVPAALLTLRGFLDAHPVDAFYIYVMKETSPAFHWDATGVATAGRYLVRVAGDWNQTSYVARTETSVEFIEVA
jgi:hypothetical protein